VLNYNKINGVAVYGTNYFGGSVCWEKLTLTYAHQTIIFSIKEKLYFISQFFFSARKMFMCIIINRRLLWEDNIIRRLIYYVILTLNIIYQYITQKYVNYKIFLQHKKTKICLTHLAYQKNIPIDIIKNIYNIHKSL